MFSMSGRSEALDAPATYNDGITATSRSVRLSMEGGDLLARDAEGFELVRWPLAEVHLVAKPGDGQAPRLACGFDRDDRLTLEDEAPLAELARRCPKLRHTTPGWKGHGREIALWGGLAAASVAILTLVIIPLVAKAVAVSLPPSVERAMGDGVKEQIIQVLTFRKADGSTRICEGEEGRALLEQLARRLDIGGDPEMPVTLTVVDSKTVNALALPGGHVLVLRGLIDLAEDGNELAGVLAHEIGHVHERHPLEVAMERAGTSVLIGFLLGDVTGGTVLAFMAEALVNSAYTREAEREADAIGIDLMNRAGLEASGIGDLLGRIAKKGGEMDGWLGFLSTHPHSRERAAAARRDSRATGQAFTDAEWKAVKAMCD